MATSKFTTAHCIYRIVCSLTGKVYIGQTSNIKNRRNKHFARLKRGIHENQKLQRAYNKYGAQYFYLETIEHDVPFMLINSREKYWIEKFNSFQNGYNLTRGGYDKGSIGKQCIWNGVQYASIADAARANNVKISTMHHRISHGKTSDKDISIIIRPCIWNGVSYKSISQCAIANNIDGNVMERRINKGYVCDADVPAREKKTTWNDVTYISISACARAINVTSQKLRRWLELGYRCDHDIPPKSRKLSKPINTLRGVFI